MREKINFGTAGVAVALLGLVIALAAIYVFKAPTTRRMDFIVLSSFAVSAFALVIVDIFPRVYGLAVAVVVGQAIVVLAGLAGVVTLVATSLLKVSFPIYGISQQWLGLAGYMAVFAIAIGGLAVGSFNENKDWVTANPLPEKAPNAKTATT